MIPTKRIEIVDWHDIQDAIENHLSAKQKRMVNLRDYADKYDYHNQCVAQISAKYGDSWYTTQPADFTEQERQAHEEYCDLKASGSPPYQDFWHWWIENAEPDVSNGYLGHLNYNSFMHDLDDDCPDWVREILMAMGEVLASEQRDGISIQYEW